MTEPICCLHPSCNRARKLRGLCSNHYTLLQRAVKAGELTWEQAVADGRCLASRMRAAASEDYARQIKLAQMRRYRPEL